MKKLILVLLLLIIIINVSAQELALVPIDNSNQDDNQDLASSFNTSTDLKTNQLNAKALLLKFFIYIIIFEIISYIYSAIALMEIAKKTNTPNGWMAFIPIANIVLILNMARLHWTYIFLMIISVIPVIGYPALAVVSIWWYWKICERRGFPGWISILMGIPILSFIGFGIVAWGKGKTIDSSSIPADKSNIKRELNNPQVQRIREYINAARTSGKSNDVIIRELKDAGWPDHLINLAFTAD